MSTPSIRILPEQAERVESGPVQFGNDWPGVFIRGDHAGHYALVLKQFLDTQQDMHILEKAVIQSLLKDLSSCIVGPASELLQERIT